jgi:hypothetical protein
LPQYQPIASRLRSGPHSSSVIPPLENAVVDWTAQGCLLCLVCDCGCNVRAELLGGENGLIIVGKSLYQLTGKPAVSARHRHLAQRHPQLCNR